MALAGVVAAIAAMTPAAGLHAQSGVTWRFEDVAPIQYPNPACVSGMTLAGFEYDPQGRPVLAWREENDCGGPPRVFWTRKEGGVWNPIPIRSGLQYDGTALDGHFGRLILRPSDGNPFFIYRDVAPGNYLNTYESDLGANPFGANPVFLEPLVGPQTCAYMTYAPAFAPGAPLPDWVSVFIGCNGYGNIRLDGAVVGGVSPSGPSLTVTPDGARHVLWIDGDQNTGYAFHTGPAGTTTLFSNINRRGGETAIATDANGVLHAVVRGVEGDQADWDTGAVVYMTSADGGQTWSPFEYVDPVHDAVPNSIGLNHGISLALDADGIPAVTYWRWVSELWYARRDGPGGTWTQSRVTTADPSSRAPRTAQLRFDAAGVPTIALYDVNAGKVRLATPLPFGESVPVDIAIAGSVTPAAVQSGGLLTYTLTVTNRGATNVDNVIVSNALPAGATFVDAAPAGNGGLWVVGLLTSGASATITVRARAPITPGDAADVATVTSDGVDADSGNNIVAIHAAVRPDQCFPPASGLAGLWRGEGSTLDSSPFGRHGLAQGGVSYGPGVNGTAFLFDGTTGSVNVYEDRSFNELYPQADSFSVIATVKSSTTTGLQNVASKYECGGYCPAGSNSRYGLLLVDGAIHGTLRDTAGGTTDLQGASLVADGEFHQLALVRDVSRGELRLYVDGMLDASAALAGGAAGAIKDDDSYYDPFTIGARQLGGQDARTEFFNGTIDDVAVYGRALSDAELQSLVAAAASPVCGAPALAPPIITVPDDMTVEATGPAGATVDFAASAVDANGASLATTCTPSSGTPFGITTTTVTCSATDGNSLSTSGSFTVTVVDTTPPVVTGTSVTVEATGASGGAASYAASATDLVDGAVAVSCTPASGSTFALGTTPVHCTATDAHGNTGHGDLTVTVVAAPPPPPPSNRAPDCSAAGPSVGVIWPPNHKLVVPVTITGVVDADGDAVAITITRILQDEPVNITGDGNTPVDGFGVGTSTARVRAERTGVPKNPGNGRVYEIQFRAVDPSGAACTGAVTTGVPHDQSKPITIVDDRIRYDSTVAGGGRVR